MDDMTSTPTMQSVIRQSRPAFQQSLLKYLTKSFLLALSLSVAIGHSADAQQATPSPQAQPAPAPKVQPAEVGSPTDPKRGERVPLPVPANPKLPTLFLVGDSTVRNGQGNGAGG